MLDPSINKPALACILFLAHPNYLESLITMLCNTSVRMQLASAKVHRMPICPKRKRAWHRSAIEKQGPSSSVDEQLEVPSQAPGLQAPDISTPQAKAASIYSLPYQFIASVAGAGALETAYLTLVKLTGSSPVCPVSGCETVLNSSYSELYGVPLSLLGMLTYGAVAATALQARQKHQEGSETSTLNTLLTAGATTLAGVSGMLLYILATRFPGDACLWCYGSAALSFTLLASVVMGTPSRQLAANAAPGLGALATTLAVLYLGFGAAEPSTADDFELPYNAPIVTTDSSDKAKALAKRLKDAGAQMYGAFWCSHCYDQKQTFGKDAMADFPYVECYPDGWKRGVKVAPACDAAGVRAFPTWVINGRIVEGDLSLDALSQQLELPSDAPNVYAVPPSPFKEAS